MPDQESTNTGTAPDDRYVANRHVYTGPTNRTSVLTIDMPGNGNSNHAYQVLDNNSGQTLLQVHFQNGPLAEDGFSNGIGSEDLVAILIDHIVGFQTSKFNCKQNADALRHLKKALEYMNDRTQERQARGVEGTQKV